MLPDEQAETNRPHEYRNEAMPVCLCTDPPPDGCPACRDDAFSASILIDYRDRIANLRRTGCHLTASIMRDELLAQLERFLDPAGMAYTRACQAEQGRAALVSSLERIEDCPF